MGNFITSREVRIADILQTLNITLPQLKNFNIHIPTKLLNQIQVFGNRLLDGVTLGYSFIVFHDHRRSTTGEYTYNLDGKISIGYLPKEYIQANTLQLQSSIPDGKLIHNSKYTIDYLQEHILFSGKLKDVGESIMETLGKEQDRDLVNQFSENYENTYLNNQTIDKFTKKEFACILLKVPETSEPWLNNLIIKSRELDKKLN